MCSFCLSVVEFCSVFAWFKKCFISLLLALLGLRCCVGFSLVVVNGAYSLFVVWRLFIVVALLLGHGLQVMPTPVCSSWALEYRLSSCDAQAQLLHAMWYLHRPGILPMSPALVGRFFTTDRPRGPVSAFLLLPTIFKQLYKVIFNYYSYFVIFYVFYSVNYI